MEEDVLAWSSKILFCVTFVMFGKLMQKPLLMLEIGISDGLSFSF